MTTPPTVAERVSELPLLRIGASRGFVMGTRDSLRDIWGYRGLLGLLVRREVKVKYKDSTLGFAWSLMRPLALLAVYYVAIGKFLEAERAIPSFAIYVFTGLTAWQLFSEVVSSSTSSMLSNAALVKKVYLPREVFPLSTVGAALFNLLVQLGVLVAATLLLRAFPTGSRWLFLPLAVAVLVIYATAIGLVMAAVNVYLRDVQYLVEIALMVLFWTAPVVYSYELVANAVGEQSRWLDLYLANPVAAAVLGMQQTFWVAGDGTPVPENLGTRLAVMAAIGVVLLWVCQRIFARLQGNFAQEL